LSWSRPICQAIPRAALHADIRQCWKVNLRILQLQWNIESPRARAREFRLLSEGAISMMLIHGDRSYAAAAAKAAKRLIQSA